jgi:predicted ABC-class ATPase
VHRASTLAYPITARRAVVSAATNKGLPLEYQLLLSEKDKEKLVLEKEKLVLEMEKLVLEKEKENITLKLSYATRDNLWLRGQLSMRGLFCKSSTRIHRCSRLHVNAGMPHHISF